jgi:hypothetical protein
MRRIGLIAVMVIGWAGTSAAADKNQYHLFNPTPRELMREMSTDRPDKTESAYTVDAGHYQLEMSALDYVYNHRNDPAGDDTRTDTWSLAPWNFKAGLLNNVDLQWVVSPHVIERSREAQTERKRGFGDMQTRLKVNLWGNDGGATALAVMPFVKYPTNSDDLGNNDVESGVIIPLAIALPAEWSMGLMTEFDFNRNEADDGYRTEYVNSVTVSHAIVGDLNGYLEFFSRQYSESNIPWEGSVDAGLTYGINENTQLDMGVNVGVTRSTDDVNPFVGLSLRY